MKKIYTGIESSGKSLQLAREVKDIVWRNHRWFKKTGIMRPIRSNMRFRQNFEKWAFAMAVPIYYWDNLEEIIYEQECDVIIDEVVKFFDSRQWSTMTLDAKHWLTQGAKSGVWVYGSSQDFSQVDKQFRLLCNKVYVITKFIGSPRPMKTAPTSKRVWGICVMREVDPRSFKGDSVSMETVGFPWPFLIQREDTEIFDTNAKIIPSDLPIKNLRKQIGRYVNPKTGEIEHEKITYI